VLGLGFRRGVDPAARYWVVTLLYPDEATARVAGAALTERIAAYTGVKDGQPLLGTDVVEQLEPVVTTGDVGATVSVRLRVASDRPASLFARFLDRDVDFLVPGR